MQVCFTIHNVSQLHENILAKLKSLYFCFQGDLDRQRLLGNRQRIGVYESNVDDGDTEGLEHQERLASNDGMYKHTNNSI